MAIGYVFPGATGTPVVSIAVDLGACPNGSYDERLLSSTGMAPFRDGFSNENTKYPVIGQMTTCDGRPKEMIFTDHSREEIVSRLQRREIATVYGRIVALPSKSVTWVSLPDVDTYRAISDREMSKGLATKQKAESDKKMVGDAVADAFSRAPSWAAALATGAARKTKSGVAFGQPGNGPAYGFEVKSATCSPAAVGKTQCVYEMSMYSQVSLLNYPVFTADSGLVRRTDLFTMKGDALRSSDLDAEMTRISEVMNRPGRSSSVSSPQADPEKSRREINAWLCVNKPIPCGY